MNSKIKGKSKVNSDVRNETGGAAELDAPAQGGRGRVGVRAVLRAHTLYADGTRSSIIRGAVDTYLTRPTTAVYVATPALRNNRRRRPRPPWAGGV